MKINYGNKQLELIIPINDYKGLIKLANAFPERKEEFIKPILQDTEEYKRIVTSYNVLIQLGQTFPEYKQDLITPILKVPKIYKQLVPDYSALIMLLKTFDEYEKLLIRPVLKYPEQYQRIITSSHALKGVAKACHDPEHIEKLIKPLQNPEEYKRIVDVIFLTNDETLSIFHKHKKALIEPLQHNPELFKHCVNNMFDLNDLLVKYCLFSGIFFPECEEKVKKMIAPMMQDAEVFRRIVKNIYNLNSLKIRYFYNLLIFQKDNIEEVAKAIAKTEIEKAGKIIHRSKYGSNTGFFSRLPDDVNIKVLSLLGDVNDEKESLDIAKHSYSALAKGG